MYRKFESDYKSLLNLAERFSLIMARLRSIVTEVYKAINGMLPECLQYLFVIKANGHDLRDNNKMKLYKFKTMSYGKHSIKYTAGILWNSINVDIKNTDNVNVFKRKIRNWQGPICQCGKCLICIFCYTFHLYIFHIFIGFYFIFHIIIHHRQKALVLVLIVFIVFHVK